MAKRFIDTALFDDDWFMDLSKDAKLLWIYFITKCDHAGMLKLNIKLCKVQTDIKDLNETIILLGNRLVTVSEHLYFIPKFIEFQYPGFPNSKAKAQISAIEILKKHRLLNEDDLTVNELLGNSYSNNNSNNKDNNKEKREELLKKREEEFRQLVFENDPLKYPQTMLQKFCDYWTEKNKSGTKMRWELQQTFEIRKRLATWTSKDNEFNKTNNSVFDKYLKPNGK